MTIAERMVERMEVWPIERLTPYARNARTHSDGQVAQIAASIQRFGFNNPILVASDTGIVAGHGRYQAARKLGLSRVPVIVLDHLTETERRAYVIADNKIAENAGWDNDLLTSELAALNDLEFDLETLGFDERELEKILGAPDDPAADDCPAVEERAITQPGDLWLLGRHRLLCGDATNDDHVERLMAGARPAVCITSPPYNLGSNHHTATKSTQAYDDDKPETEYQCEQVGLLELMARTVQGDCFYQHKNRIRDGMWITPLSWVGCGSWRIVQELVWINGGPNMDPCRFYPQTERIWWLTKADSLTQFENVEHLTDWWQIAPVGAAGIHTRACPVEIPRRLLVASRGRSVIDPYCGSGTTIIAAEKLNRSCYGLELEPRYCDVIIRRWQTYTGKQATRESDGRPFDAIASAI